MPLDTWLLYVLVALVPAFSPGPGMLLALKNTLQYGPRAVLYSVTGNSLGLTLVGFGVAYGLSSVMEASALAFTVLKGIGALYLIYLGIGVFRDRTMLTPIKTGENKAKGGYALFSEAFVIALFNPKAVVLLAAMFPQFMQPAETSDVWLIFEVNAVLVATMVVLSICAHGVVAWSGHRLRRLFNSETSLGMVRRVLGTFFIGFGLALAAASR